MSRVHIRTSRLAVPVAVSVLALFGTGLTATGAQAASTTPEPTTKELGKRVARSMTTDQQSRDVSKPVPPQKSAPEPPKSSPYIIGGNTETISNAPWMAQLHYYDDRNTPDKADDEAFFCGGTVVAPTKILTASHCVDGLNWTLDSVVVVGATKLPTVDSGGVTNWQGGTPVTVRRQWKHPSYNAGTTDNDVAVLTLAKPVNVPALPVARSTDTGNYAVGNTAEVYGWGRYTSGSQAVSPTLKKASLPLVSDDTCAGFWGDYLIRGHMVCAGTPASGSDAGTTTACNGDSGGPLVRNGRLIGVVSWGVEDCVYKGAYGVYAKVTSYAGPIRARAYDTDWNKDGQADMLARRASDGKLFPFHSKGTSLSWQASVPGDYKSDNLLVQADLDLDGSQDIIRRTAAGDLYRTFQSNGTWQNTKLAAGWQTRRTFLAPGDVNGNDVQDLISVDSAGRLRIHPGNGKGGFYAEVDGGPGWQIYSQVLGHGDLTGDGKTDLLARTPAGEVYLYKGTGTLGLNTFAPRVKVATLGSSYTAFATVGDVNNDGKADLLAREGDALWLFPGTGSSTGATFATRKAFGTAWAQFNLFG
ncbi:trypsin-like serine protease [Streptomyces sp. NPDC048603]|uniref:trypsin-like serine protease n=1 Tax=Streptomyces sp. NPDC048603 TaxID=3365577 RepID=UPI0037149D30